MSLKERLQKGKSKTLNAVLTNEMLEPYSIKVDTQNITLMKSGQTIGYYSDFETALKKASELKTLELATDTFGEVFPIENYVKSLYKIRNIFNNQVVKSLDDQLKNLRKNES